jgi:hypothetical protein
MTQVLQRGIETLIHNGLVEILIFALVFAMVYGILQSIQLFGDNEKETKKYNLIIAVAFGALVIIPHYIAPGSNYDIVPMVQRALPHTMLVALAALGLMILLGLFGLDKFISSEGDGNKYSWVVAVVLLVIIVYIFVGATGTVWGLPRWLTPDLIAGILALLVFGLIVSFVLGGSSETTP